MEPAQSQALSESLLAAMPQLREKPHLGVPSSNPALYLGHEVCKSTTVLGLRAALHLERVQSRSTGKERDTESGNDYFDARYYGSSMGRFLSPDEPFADFDPENPQSWNLYGYVRNNPLINTDPDGNDCVNGSNAANGSILVQTTQNASDCKAGFTYVNGTVDPNSVTYKNGQLGFNISNYADGSGIAASVTMASGSQLDPDTLKAGVFGSPSASTWRNANGVVTAAASAELMAASFIAPEILLEDTELLGLGLVDEDAPVIGKMSDIRKGLRPGEREVNLPDQGSPKANWAQNSSKLRYEMSQGKPIRDVSAGNPGSNTGFLKAERNLLQNNGWTLKGEYWVPPGR
jgi:RHS repeat-associated protein